MHAHQEDRERPPRPPPSVRHLRCGAPPLRGARPPLAVLLGGDDRPPLRRVAEGRRVAPRAPRQDGRHDPRPQARDLPPRRPRHPPPAVRGPHPHRRHVERRQGARRRGRVPGPRVLLRLLTPRPTPTPTPTPTHPKETTMPFHVAITLTVPEHVRRPWYIPAAAPGSWVMDPVSAREQHDRSAREAQARHSAWLLRRGR